MTQQELDFDRGSQLGIIRRFARSLPPYVQGTDARISKQMVIAVVRAIDDHADDKKRRLCSCSAATIAKETGISTKTIGRVIRWLRDNDMLIVQRTKTVNLYRLAWSNLKPECEQKPDSTLGHEDSRLGHGVPTLGHENSTLGHGVRHTRPSDGHKNAIETHIYNCANNVEVVDYGDIEYFVDRIAKHVPIRTSNDQWLVHHVAGCIVIGDMSEADLELVLETLRESRKPVRNAIAYFNNAIIARCYEGDSAKFKAVCQRFKIVGWNQHQFATTN